MQYAYVELHSKQTQQIACQFIERMIDEFAFKVHTILTDNGSQFTYRLLSKHTVVKKIHPLDQLCNKHNIKHKLTQFRHPWTNGQVEIFNKSFKTHTTKRYDYESEKELRRHAQAYILLYNHQKPLKSYQLKTPYELMLDCYQKNPDPFQLNPNDLYAKLNK